jgi:hypothetical protein|tara:strand:- start:501 stop:755 length:255 start_codon:yes stop_codon:yes gene_type:complete
MEDDTNTDHNPGHAGEEAELVDVVTQSHSPGYMAQIWEKAKLKEDTDTDHSSEHAQEEDAVEEVVTGYHSLGYMVLLGFRSLQC